MFRILSFFEPQEMSTKKFFLSFFSSGIHRVRGQIESLVDYEVSELESFRSAS